MRRFRKWMSDVTGVTRREKRATIIAGVILAALIIIRYTSGSADHVTIVVSPLESQPGTGSPAAESVSAPVLFVFDPNSVSHDDLVSLGVDEKTASTMINYREAGARFYRPSDLLRVYGVDSQLVKRLSPYMRFGQAAVEDHPPEERSGMVIGQPSREEERPAIMIELNTCTAAELESLPGIGEVLSGRIIRFRDMLGGFVSTQQLGEVYGIDTSYLERILSMVCVNTDSVHYIAIDSCSYSDLARHPYIGPEAARAILRYRELIGPPHGVDELVRQRVIDSATARRMKPYCIFAGVAERGAGVR